jgi:DEAD/DEAH box helicase domain-containing protein
MHSLTEKLNETFLLIFPTKALAQDQKVRLCALAGNVLDSTVDVRIDTFDGDTPRKGPVRKDIQQLSSVVLTNPDMLHRTILPKHKHWHQFLSKLKFVVVDGLLHIFMC